MNDPWGLALAATELLEKGDLRGALKLLDRCVRAGGEGWGHLLRARTKLALGKSALAVADVTRAFDADPECGWVFGMAVERAPVPARAEAAELARRHRAYGPSCWPARAFVGKLRLMAGRPDGLGDLDAAVAAAPAEPYLWAWRAEALRRLGRHAEAKADADRALALDPRHAVALAARAAARRKLGDAAGALADASRAAALMPGYEVAALEAARAALAVGDGRAVLRWLEAASKRAARIGWLSLSEERRLAPADFTRLSAGLPERLRGRLEAWRGEALLATGDARGAALALGRAAGDPAFPQARGWLGEALLAVGELGHAKKELDAALARPPRRARALAARARLALEERRPADALKDLAAAMKAEPDWVLPRLLAARAHDALGRRAEALAELDSALRFDPRFAEALELRARLRRDQGDPAGALADLRRRKELA
jgi:tetratricopeptide (TPR) repeat protein